MPRPTLRRAVLGVAAAAALTAVPVSASAHVHVHADSTASGGDADLTFAVPTESDTARTTALTVTLPQDQPFLSVRPLHLDGWTTRLTEAPLPAPATDDGTTITKAVRTVTWTAEAGHGVPPGEFQEFVLSVGPLPDPGTLQLPARQTYSDGTTVDWNQPTPASGDEPEHPAPTLAVTAAVTRDAPSTAGDPDTSTADHTGRWLGGAALAVSLVALALSTATAGRRRRT